MKRAFSLVLFFLFITILSGIAQDELKILEFSAVPTNVAAQQYPIYDYNNQLCGLILLDFASEDAAFSGDIISSEYKDGVWWIYIISGANRLIIKSKSSQHQPLTCYFKDYPNVKEITSGVTYKMSAKIDVNPVKKLKNNILGSLQAGELKKAQEAYSMYTLLAERDLAIEYSIDSLAKVVDSLLNPKDINLTFSVYGLKFKMIYVEGDTFQMGSDYIKGDKDEQPPHQVILSDYYMGEIEVTQALWQVVMGTTFYQQRAKEERSNSMQGVGPNYPMCYVNYNEAQEFCVRLTSLLQTKLPEGYRFSLPTEAEWEYAAGGGMKTKYSLYAGSEYISTVAVYKDNSNQRMSVVKSKAPNELGLYDMSGNAWEWCSDWYDEEYYMISPIQNPLGPDSGDVRSVRGGCCIYLANSCRVTSRSYATPKLRNEYGGFRLALVKR